MQVYYGLSTLVAGFIRQRDLPPPLDAPPVDVRHASFRAAADEFGREASAVRRRLLGARWIVATARARRLCNASDPVAILRDIEPQLERMPDSEGRDEGATPSAETKATPTVFGRSTPRGPRIARRPCGTTCVAPSTAGWPRGSCASSPS